MALKRFDPSKFTANTAKPLPVMLLLDVSASMGEVLDGSYARTGRTVYEDGKKWELVEGGRTRIDVLNEAVREMIASFAREEQLGHEFLVSVITFGGSARVHLPPTKASKVEWKLLTVAGETPLGEAITLAKKLIEDKETTPSRAFRPVVILVSDGRPDTGWEAPLEAFVASGRSMKCDRITLSIAESTDEQVLRRFIAGTPNPLFHATDAGQILETFRRVTMSVTLRSKSKDPNQAPAIESVVTASPPAQSQAQPQAPAQPQPPEAPPRSVGDSDDGYW